MSLKPFLLGFCVVASPLAAQATTLDSVRILATRDSAAAAPASITTLGLVELTRRTGLFLDEALNMTPGVRMERRTMNGGQRITIRGYGNRTNFDGSGYKAYLNDIPVTDAEGVTVLDDIDAATLGRVDVVRGPASTGFGAGIGGVVRLYTLRPDRPGTSVSQGVTAGADGLQRYDTRLTTSGASSTMLLNYGHQGYDSYRIHSGSTKDYATALGDFRPSDRRNVSAFLTYAHSFDLRAGQLDSAQFFGKENTGETRYLNNDAHVDLESLRMGATHRLQLSNRVENATTGYYSGNTREDIFAAGVNPKSAQTFGARTTFTTRLSSPFGALTGRSGGEFQKTNAFAKGYGLNNGTQGGITTDLETRTSQGTIFTEWDLGLRSDITLTAGAGLNFIEYALEDRLTNTANPTHRDLTGRKVYDPVLTPRVALRKNFGDAATVFASVSQGFTPSTSSDAVIAFTGEANEGLKPERGTQFEIGSHGVLFDRRLTYQVALFDLRVSDKLTSQGVFDGTGTLLYSYTTNAGDQSNKGAEVAVGYDLLRGREMGMVNSLRPFLTYTYSDFTFTDFKSDNNASSATVDFSGKQVPGVPKNVFVVGADAATRPGLYGNVSYEHVDAMPITNDNVHSAPAYSLLNAKLGIRRAVGRGFDLDAFVGGNNLTGSLYYTMVFLNANFAGPSPAIYLPGPYEAKLFGGVKLSYRH